MKIIRSFIYVIFVVFLASVSFADHTPNKLMRNMKAYANLGVTGKLGPFNVNSNKFGNLPKKKKTTVEDKNFEKIFGDKYNLAAIIMKGDDIVYERYN